MTVVGWVGGLTNLFSVFSLYFSFSSIFIAYYYNYIFVPLFFSFLRGGDLLKHLKKEAKPKLFFYLFINLPTIATHKTPPENCSNIPAE